MGRTVPKVLLFMVAPQEIFHAISGLPNTNLQLTHLIKVLRVQGQGYSIYLKMLILQGCLHVTPHLDLHLPFPHVQLRFLIFLPV